MISPQRLIPLVLLMTSLWAAERPILLLNSDGAVEKYNLVAAEFQRKYSGRMIRTYDLQLKPLSSAQLEDLILECNPVLIFCIGSKAFSLTTHIRESVPILFTSVINWQRFQLMPRSYGIASEVSTEMQFILFKYLFPKLKTLGVLYSQEYNQEWFGSAQAATGDLKVSLVGQIVRASSPLAEQLDRLLPGVDALWLISDPGLLSDKSRMELVFAKAAQYQKPIFTYDNAYADMGATLIISADQPTLGRQAARLADLLINQQGLSTRIEDPVGTHVIINMRKIRDYKLTFNADALDSVNQIIE